MREDAKKDTSLGNGIVAVVMGYAIYKFNGNLRLLFDFYIMFVIFLICLYAVFELYKKHLFLKYHEFDPDKYKNEWDFNPPSKMHDWIKWTLEGMYEATWYMVPLSTGFLIIYFIFGPFTKWPLSFFTLGD